MHKLDRRSQRVAAPQEAAGKLTVVYQPIAELTPDPKNPRLHSRRQVRQIARSIETFGFNVPILVDRDHKVIAGHGRLLAARELGWSEVPTIQLEHLTEAQVKAFMIADNRLTEIGVWDDRLLAEQLRELSELDLGFSLEVRGFSMGEIDLRIEGLTATNEHKDDPADALPSPGPGVSRLGDLWVLGRHRVLCGSALDAVAYLTLMRGDEAVMIFTDPPYNVPIDGHASGLGAIRHRDFVMAAGEMSSAEFTAFLMRSCRLLARHSADGSLHFICMDWRHMDELQEAGRAAYSELKNVCVWVKSNAGMGSLYRSCTSSFSSSSTAARRTATTSSSDNMAGTAAMSGNTPTQVPSAVAARRETSWRSTLR